MRKWLNKLLGRKDPAPQPQETLRKTVSVATELKWQFQDAVMGDGSIAPLEYRNGVKTGHRGNPVVFACADKISKAAMGIPLQVMEKKMDGDDEEVVDHLLLDLLARPNQHHSMAFIIGFTFLNLLYAKRAYLLLIKLGSEQSLWPLVPDAVEMKMGQDGKPSHYEYSQENGTRVRYELDQVLAVWTPDPLSMYEGTSRLDPARSSILCHNLATKHSVKLLKTGARIPGMLVVDAELSDETREGLGEFTEQLQGPEATGKIPVLENSEAKYIPFGHSPKDIDYVKGKELSIFEICMVLGVDPILIWPTQSSYNNKAEAKKSLYEDAVIPTFQYLLDELNQFIRPHYHQSGKKVYLKMNLSKVPALQQNQGEKWKNDLDAVEKGTMNRETFALRNGLPVPTDKNAKKYFHSASQIPVEGFDAHTTLGDDE